MTITGSTRLPTGMVMALGVILVSCAGPEASPGSGAGFPLGAYVMVTESEWGVLMLLREDHTVRIELAAWSADCASEPVIEIHEGTWVLEGNVLTATFDQGIARFEYGARTSFDDFGGVGNAPGFRHVSGTFRRDWFRRPLHQKTRIREVVWPGYGGMGRKDAVGEGRLAAAK